MKTNLSLVPHPVISIPLDCLSQPWVLSLMSCQKLVAFIILSLILDHGIRIHVRSFVVISKTQTHLKNRYSPAKSFDRSFVCYLHRLITFEVPPLIMILEDYWLRQRMDMTVCPSCQCSCQYKSTFSFSYIWLFMQVVWWVRIRHSKLQISFSPQSHFTDGLQSIPQWENAFNHPANGKVRGLIKFLDNTNKSP